MLPATIKSRKLLKEIKRFSIESWEGE